MITTIVILLFFLLASVALNIFLVIYVKWVIRKLLYISVHSNGMLGMIKEYLEFLKRLYKLEVYQNDDTIKALVKATQDIVREFEAYNDSYKILESDNFPDEEEDEEDNDANKNKEE